METTCERLSNSRAGQAEIERPCSLSLHFLKLPDDLIASVSAAPATASQSTFAGSDFSAGRDASVPTGPEALGGGATRSDAVDRGLSSPLLSRLTASPAARLDAMTSLRS